MPRGRKRKLLIDAKHHQAQDETQSLSDAKEEAVASSSPPPVKAVVQRKPGARSGSNAKQPQRALSTTITESAGVSKTRVSEEASSNLENKQSSSKATPSKKRPQSVHLNNTTRMLVQFLMQKYKMKQPIRKEEMLKIIQKKYKKCFKKILKRASFNIEVVFGVDLKEVDATKHSYTLVSKMDLPNNGRVSRDSRALPKTGLLMNILGVIFMSGNCATEQKIWEFLNKMRIYAGKKHFLFGEPKKLITQDFVKLQYLEHRQVPDSDPPSYKFRGGPRAHAETTKMKVLEFWAKINHTIPSAFTFWYEEALQDEERAQATVPPRADTNATAQDDSGPCPAAAPTPGEVD